MFTTLQFSRTLVRGHLLLLTPGHYEQQQQLRQGVQEVTQVMLLLGL
jgi:hypothetical protein